MSKYEGYAKKGGNMQSPQINVTPLIDVLLVLLIIFMVVTPTKPSSFKTKVPAEPRNAPPAEAHPDTLIVTVDRASALGLNFESGLGSVAEPAKLVDRLRNIFETRKANYGVGDSSNIPTSVFIKAPRGLDYGSVAKVVDAVKSSGADPIALQIDDLN